MTSTELLPATVLKRKAVVYIRQSTQAQVQSNLESQRRQYELVDVSRLIRVALPVVKADLESKDSVIGR
jgi:DNA invertase Pin-like site-specific DNA recombinase